MSKNSSNIDGSEIDWSDPQVARLVKVSHFARHVVHMEWFSRIGQSISAEELRITEDYLSAIGFPNTNIATVTDWNDAAAVAETPAWNSGWWEAEEQLRAALIADALMVIDERELTQSLNHVTAQTAGQALVAIDEAAKLHTIESNPNIMEFLNAAAGIAVASSYHAGLAIAAQNEAEHPFSIKFRLFENGRLPLGMAGNTFSIF